jgi:AcrR family transcriptional regulator
LTPAPAPTGISDTKASLLEAAKRLVAERGYAGTSVRDLAAASGANLAAVSYHFGSREELLNQAVLECFLDWTDRFGQMARSDPDAQPLARMGACTRSILEDFPDTQPLFAAFLEALLQARRSPKLQARLAEHYCEQRRRVATALTGQSEDDVPPTRTVEMLASLLIAVVDGLLLQSLLDPAAIPTADELAALAESST